MQNSLPNKIQTLLVVLFMGLVVISNAQLEVDNSAPANDPNHLINNVLVGGGVSISNITFSGNPQQFGTFKGGGFLGFEEGIILSTGKVTDAITDDKKDVPGDPGASGSFAGGTVSEADLITLSQKTDAELGINGGGGLLDLLVINFDFVPTSDSVVFRYVFASEEYPEWVNSKFNDVFGFFISGPGMNGDYTNNAENLAIVPGTNDLGVTVSSVHGPYNNIPALNEQFYIDNPLNEHIEFDGYTTVFVVKAKVQPCETYRLKIAIADKGSETYDSAVFLEAKSLQSPGLVVSESTLPKSADGLAFFEGCGSGEITVTREWGTDQTQSIDLDIGPGSTVDAADINGIPTTVTFAPGQVSKTISFTANLDGVAEGNEKLVIATDYSNICSNTTFSQEFIIKDFVPLSFKEPGPDTTFYYCPGQSYDLIADPIGGYGRYTYEWTSNGSVISGNKTLSVIGNSVAQYKLTVSDTCNGGSISKVYILYPSVSDPLQVEAGTTKNIDCKGSEIFLEPDFVKGGVGNYKYEWYLKTGQVLSTNKRLQVTVTEDTQFFVDVTDECETVATDSVFVLLAKYQPLKLNVAPQTKQICSGELVVLKATPSGGAGGYTYLWNYQNDTTNKITVKPTIDTEYRITVEDICGDFRSASAYITVDDIYAQMEVNRVNDFDFYASNKSLGYNFGPVQPDETVWLLDGVKIGTSPDIDFQINDFDTHTLTLIVTDRVTKCTSTAVYIIEPPLSIYVPNAFTPNGDGVNDTFKVIAPEADSFRIYIFDRWGREIWTSNDINEAWTGRSTKSGEFIHGVVVARIKVGKGNNIKEFVTPIRIIQ